MASSPLVFKPRPSLGWLSLLLLGLFWVVVFILPAVTTMAPSPPLSFLVLGVFLTVYFLGLAVSFPAMRYELGADELILRCGPWLVYTIPLTDIHGFRSVRLGFSSWSSLRLPGVTLFSVHVPRVGRVRMCATAAFGQFLILETAAGLYGVTPADEAAFSAALGAARHA